MTHYSTANLTIDCCKGLCCDVWGAYLHAVQPTAAKLTRSQMSKVILYIS